MQHLLLKKGIWKIPTCTYEYSTMCPIFAGFFVQLLNECDNNFSSHNYDFFSANCVIQTGIVS